MEEWMGQMRSIHNCKISAFERKDVLIPASTWTNFADILLSGVSQPQKDTSRKIPLPGGPQRSSCPQRQRGEGGSQGWGRGWGVRSSWGQSLSVDRWKVLEKVLETVWGAGKFWRWRVGWCASCRRAVHLAMVEMVEWYIFCNFDHNSN